MSSCALGWAMATVPGWDESGWDGMRWGGMEWDGCDGTGWMEWDRIDGIEQEQSRAWAQCRRYVSPEGTKRCHELVGRHTVLPPHHGPVRPRQLPSFLPQLWGQRTRLPPTSQVLFVPHGPAQGARKWQEIGHCNTLNSAHSPGLRPSTAPGMQWVHQPSLEHLGPHAM